MHDSQRSDRDFVGLYGDILRSLTGESAATAEVAELNADAPREAAPPQHEVEPLEARRGKQDIEWRRIVFYTVLITVGITLIVSLVLILLYAFTLKRDMHPTVLAAWFGASVVQVIGLLAIVTRSLFPNNGHKD